MAQCNYPITIRDKLKGTDINPKYILVPCGKCISCIQRKRSEWSFRLKQEAKISDQATFLTLTYDESHIPTKINEETGNITNPLDKKEIQKYFKRVRHKNPELKYYAVGEYGGQTKRPHYHAIVFNASNNSLVDAWTDPNTENNSSKGFVRCDSISDARIHYVTGYVVTKYGKIDEKTGKSIDTYTIDDVRPFAIMSKGLGKIYLKQNQKFHKSKMSTTVYSETGQPNVLPRYYRDRIFTESEKNTITIDNQAQIVRRLQDSDTEYKKRKYQIALIKSQKQKRNETL